MFNLSIVIPTLQKNKQLLYNLITSLDQDSSVKEIIVIDNSLQGFEHPSEKLRIIIPETNLFVNPSWNLGVEEAKEDIVAMLNDDITIPNDFCKSIVEKMTPDMGIVGFHRDYIENIPKVMPIPKLTNIELEETNGRCGFFGIAMFFFKNSYIKIPDDIKVFWGDDWLFYQNKRKNKKNYLISGQKIYHWGSLSSSDKKVNQFSKIDSKLYRKYTRKWWNYIFNIEPVFRGFRLTLFGIEFLHHYKQQH